MIDASIVITNYNQGHLLERSIVSAIKQQYDPSKFELIIVDDGSTDDSLNKADAIIQNIFKQNPNFKFPIKLISKANGGTASARNAGMHAAQSDIVSFLDADDEYLPTKLIKSVNLIRKYGHVGVVYSDYLEKFPDGKMTITYKPAFDRDLLLHQCIVSTNSCIHKSILEKVGEFDESIKGCEDYDLWLRIAFSKFMILHIPEPLFIYYNHGQNKTNTFDMNKWSAEEKKAKTRVLQGQCYVRNSD